MTQQTRRSRDPRVEKVTYVPGAVKHEGVTARIKRMIDKGKTNHDIVVKLLPEYETGGRQRWHAKRYLRVYVKHVRRNYEHQQQKTAAPAKTARRTPKVSSK